MDWMTRVAALLALMATLGLAGDHLPYTGGSKEREGSLTIGFDEGDAWHLACDLAEGFRRRFPKLRIEVKETDFDLRVTTRKPEEGFVRIARDAIVACVHPDNPIERLSPDQLAAAFTSRAKWGNLGIEGGWANRPIEAVGCNSHLVLHHEFRELALKGRPFREDLREQPGDSAVVARVAKERGAIGFVGRTHLTKDVRIVASLPREVFLVAERPLPWLTHECMRFALSRQAQAEFEEFGFEPVTAEEARNARVELACDWNPTALRIVQEHPWFEPEREPVRSSLFIRSSDPLHGVLTRWAELFKAAHPSVGVTMEPPKGDGGASLLLNRPLISGPRHSSVPVAVDAKAVFVHPDNPIEALTLGQVAAVFENESVRTWGELRMSGDWENRPIHACAIREGGACIRTLPGGRALVDIVSTDRDAIGFASFSFATPQVRLVPVRDRTGVPRTPDLVTVAAGRYPLARKLHLHGFHSTWVPEQHEFFRIALSREGQAAVVRAGLCPVRR
jgi:ABC-type phosphate transport system substrate-binding protein